MEPATCSFISGLQGAARCAASTYTNSVATGPATGGQQIGLYSTAVHVQVVAVTIVPLVGRTKGDATFFTHVTGPLLAFTVGEAPAASGLHRFLDSHLLGACHPAYHLGAEVNQSNMCLYRVGRHTPFSKWGRLPSHSRPPGLEMKSLPHVLAHPHEGRAALLA